MDEIVREMGALRIETPPTTLRAMALERLRRAIISGMFKPGQRLVERVLCEQLGVSRSVIREVIRHLDAEGLVTTEGQGPMVARVTLEDARQIYDIRAALESAAVEACARVADAKVKAELRAAIEAIETRAAAPDLMGVLEATERFHGTVFAAGGHPIAGEIVRRLNGRIAQLRVLTLGTEGRMVSGPVRLREIFEAIARNDPEAAGAACRTQIREAYAIAERALGATRSEQG
ncbi:MAG: GntR family transcriptional regulator [Rhodovulum sulfidophilum]|uniref:GntR family transcriptional regulator n=1 Tax=Rhodovulum sulfidophilum TaxID=35806 RepID=A0A2W5NAP4_RHOSU|nr:MAG: GntR family transcriptional regulator [Rhodovulum sulfidophilum]